MSKKLKSAFSIPNAEKFNEIIINNFYTRLSNSVPSICREKDEVCLSERDLQKTEEVILKGILRTEDFMKRIYQTNLSSKVMLPQNCRFYSPLEESGCNIIVIEEPPRMRTIRVTPSLLSEYELLKSKGMDIPEYTKILEDKKPSGHYHLYLSFPYVVYTIALNQRNKLNIMYLNYRLQPLTSMNDFLLKANLPNIDSGCNVCMGDSLVYPGDGVSNIIEATDLVISAFWNGEFNADLYHVFSLYNQVAPELCGYLPWQYNSMINPSFIYNSKWILHDKTIGDIINSCVEGSGRQKGINDLVNSMLVENSPTKDKETKSYSMDSSLSIPIKVEETVGKSDGGKKVIPILTGCLNIGDDIIYKDKLYYVNSIITKKNKDFELSYKIELESEDSTEKIIVPFTDKDFQDSIRTKFMNETSSEVKIGDTKFHVGDYIRFKGPAGNTIKHLEKILTQRDGKSYVKLGKDFYNINILSNENVETFDVNNIKYYNIPLERNTRYIMYYDGDNSYTHWSDGCVATFTDINFDKDNLRYKFTVGLPSKFRELILEDNLPEKDNPLRLLPYEEPKSVEKSIMRLGDHIFRPDLSSIQFLRHPDGSIILVDPKKNDFPIAKGDLLNGNKKIEESFNLICNDGKLHVPGTNLDVTFTIGDRVVIVDWALMPPSECFKHRTITGFRTELTPKAGSAGYDSYNIMMDTVDDEGKNLSYKYIFSDSPSQIRIQIGKVRKVLSEFNGIKSGTKVTATQKSISGFMKKDVFSVVGILPDTGTTPQILCSNGHGIWFNDKSISNYEFTEVGNKKFSRMDETILDSIKFKPQQMDLVVNVSGRRPIPYVVLNDRYNPNKLIVCNTSALGGYYASLDYLPSNVVPYGVITERFTKEDLASVVDVPIIPNFHGGFTIAKKEKLICKIPRRFLNV